MGAKAFALLAVGVAGVTAWDVMVNPRCRRMLPWSDIIDCAINPPCGCPTVLHGGVGQSITEAARRFEGQRRQQSEGRGSGNAGAGGSGGGKVFPGESIPYTIYKPNLDPLGNIGKQGLQKKGPVKIAQQQKGNAQKHSNKQAPLLTSRFNPATTFRPIRGVQTQNPPGGVRPAAACEWWDIFCNLSRGRTIFGQQHQAIPGINPLNLPKIQIPTLPRIVLPTI